MKFRQIVNLVSWTFLADFCNSFHVVNLVFKTFCFKITSDVQRSCKNCAISIYHSFRSWNIHIYFFIPLSYLDYFLSCSRSLWLSFSFSLPFSSSPPPSPPWSHHFLLPPPPNLNSRHGAPLHLNSSIMYSPKIGYFLM